MSTKKKRETRCARNKKDEYMSSFFERMLDIFPNQRDVLYEICFSVGTSPSLNNTPTIRVLMCLDYMVFHCHKEPIIATSSSSSSLVNDKTPSFSMESREKFILNYFGLEDETRLGESTQELSCHIVPVSQLEFVFMKISGMNNAGTGFFDRLDQMIIERDHQGDEMGAPRKHAGNDVVDFNGIFGVFNSGTNDVLW